MSSFIPPFDIGTSDVRAYVDLPTLESDLLAVPEALYIFLNYTGRKHGVNRERQGSTTQVLRSLPFPEPDPDNPDDYLVGGDQVPFDANDPNNLQTMDFSRVQIRVRRYMMKPPADFTEESRQLSQVELQTLAATNIRRHFNAFRDNFCREEYRSHVATEIWGKSLRAQSSDMTNDAATDGLSWAMIKEYKRRAALLHLRAFGSSPGADAQALSGSYLAITDQHGINELDEDQFWRDFAIRSSSGEERSKLIKGWVGEMEQVTVVKSDRMRTSDVGPSGSPFTGHEILFLAGDPQLIDEPPDGTVQGFMTEYPVCFAEVGLPQVKQLKDDFFGERYVLAWFDTMTAQALEEMDKNPDGTNISGLPTTTAMAALLETDVALGSSRFIHRGRFV